jgi:hypothetical protein
MDVPPGFGLEDERRPGRGGARHGNRHEAIEEGEEDHA